ncbi:MAG: 3-deoxy-8-phosphooctulonate synthase, partial [Gemmatimonadales bacterium]
MKAWGFRQQPFLIAGPCVIEDDDVLFRVAEELCRVRDALGLSVCFKSSFDKANRSMSGSPRGPGLDEGLRSLERVHARSGLPLLTDVHEPEQARA